MDEERFRNTYRAEALELLDDLEISLLELESSPDDPGLINRIFRALHTIKGSGKMFGFDEIASFSHDIETIYDDVRDGCLDVSPDLINVTLSSCDVIRRMINDEFEDIEERNLLLTRLQSIQEEKTGKPKDNSPDKRKTGNTHPVVYRIRFRPCPDIFLSGTDPILLLDELREMGECVVISDCSAIPCLDACQPETCYLFWDITLTTLADEDTVRGVFIFVEDGCDLEIDIVDKKKSASHRKKPVEPDGVKASGADQRRRRKTRHAREPAQVDTLRVAVGKLDTLVDLVGELIIAQARLSQHVAATRDTVVATIAEDIEHLTTSLRENTMSLRMLPIGTSFGKFRRLVRDLSKKLDKQVEMVMDGEDTELDKTMLDQLHDPLVHIIRNSIDHGIELPEIRRSLGKDPTGTVRLSAEHTGAQVIVRVSDDGAGLDASRIRSAAIRKGIVSADTDLTDNDMFKLIFEPGFTTADEVSDVSGRGVGMDVVKRGIASLRGTTEILSDIGKGTVITLKLPLTLAIIDGLLVETGGEAHVIPQSVVRECFEQTREEMQNAHGSNVIKAWGRMVPYICLRERFGIRGDCPASRRIVICDANGGNIGVAVDRVIGNYQTVIKPLGDVYRNIEYIVGATILGDGTVALILDPAKLMDEEKARTFG